MTRRHQLALRPLYRSFNVWVGRSGVTCKSTIVGGQATPTSTANMQPNWRTCHRTYSWLPTPQAHALCNAPLARFLSSSQVRSIRSVVVLLKVWHVRVAMLQDLLPSNLV